MKCNELKQKIGSAAESIIASGLGLQKKGGKYTGQCPHGGHSKGFSSSYEWKDDHFFCYDCRKPYDVIDFARSKFGNEWLKQLHSMAGVEFKKSVVKPVNILTRDRNINGIEYLKTRGITQEIIEEYKITCTQNKLCFNYVLEDQKTVVGVKIRDINAASKTQRFSAVKGSQPYLYGAHLIKNQKIMFLCEGEIDALSMAEITKHAKDDFFCSSLPGGAQSLPGVYQNCKHLFELFEKIIIIPDQDEAGRKLKQTASELLADYDLGEIILPCLDLNDFFMDEKYPNRSIFEYLKPVLPELHSKQASDIGQNVEYCAWESGFWTIDNAIAGLQKRWATIIYGSEGSGKTTLARQMLLAMAKQGVRSAMYVGEGNWEVERDKLARLAYGSSVIEKRQNTIASANRWDTTQAGKDRFRKEYGDMIFFADEQILGLSDEPYMQLRGEIIRLIKHGVKLFVIDSLSKLLPTKTRHACDMQEYVPGDLKSIANKYGVHIILIHHTNKAGTMSGVQGIRRFVDLIIAYGRLDEDAEIPAEYQSYNPTSFAKIEKVRDEGDYVLALFAFDKDTAKVYNLSNNIKSLEYENKGYWTNFVGRVSESDVPDRRSLFQKSMDAINVNYGD